MQWMFVEDFYANLRYLDMQFEIFSQVKNSLACPLALIAHVLTSNEPMQRYFVLKARAHFVCNRKKMKQWNLCWY